MNRRLLTARPVGAFLMILLIGVLSGCDKPFQPIQENDRYFFSFNGYLDASADTQWVRVAPLREQIDTPPEKPVMQVTLEHLQSGQSAVMKDSLVLLGEEFWVLNSWTTMNIEPGQSYRLRAERPEGGDSQVTVSLPEEFPTPLVQYEISGFGPDATVMYRVMIEGIERLADVQSVWHIRVTGSGEERIITFPYRNEAYEIGNGSYNVILYPEDEQDQIMTQVFVSSENDPPFEILHRQVFVVSGGPEWNEEISSMDDLIYSLPGSISNVENGLGYLVAVFSKTIPYESCFDEQGRLTSCPVEQPLFDLMK